MTSAKRLNDTGQASLKRSALLVIDMLNDYLSPGGLVVCERCRAIIPGIAGCIAFARARGLLVVYVNTALRDTRDVLARRWGLHAVAGSWGAAVVDGLAPAAGDVVVSKRGYNGFHATDLDRTLRSAGIGEVVVSGIHTHVCVLLTAVAAFENGYAVTTLQDCITTGYAPNHRTRLRFFASHVGELRTAAEWMRGVETRWPRGTG